MPPIDRLSALLEQFPVRAQLFHAGALCGTTTFDARPGRAFVHVLRRGAMDVSHPGVPELSRLRIEQPTLLFYPRALTHTFHNPPQDGSDFVCATVDFEGGDAHPLARALPPVVIVPLASVPPLASTLELLFAEAERVQCASRLLANRLFEVLLLQLLRWLLDQGCIDVGLVAALGDARLSRALTALHEAPHEAWTVERMARCAGMSRTAFAQRFHAVMGQTPADYVAEWRIARACQLLRLGRPLGAVADAVGYSSYAALSRAFHQRIGKPPREWLRELR